MARKVRTVVDIYDDLNGELIPENTGETLYYVFDGTVYEADVSDENAARVREFIRPLLEAGRKVGKVSPKALSGPTKRKSPAPAAPAALPAGESSASAWQAEQARRALFSEVREWARENGWPEHGNYGKLRPGVREAWDAAHPDRPVPEEGQGGLYRKYREQRDDAVPVD